VKVGSQPFPYVSERFELVHPVGKPA
jgi:hypothetical protein